MQVQNGNILFQLHLVPKNVGLLFQNCHHPNFQVVIVILRNIIYKLHFTKPKRLMFIAQRLIVLNKPLMQFVIMKFRMQIIYCVKGPSLSFGKDTETLSNVTNGSATLTAPLCVLTSVI